MAMGYLLENASAYEHHEGDVTDDVPDEPKTPMEWYNLIRSSWEKRRRQCAAKLFREVAGKLEMLNATTLRRSRTGSNDSVR